jgi:ribosomal protein S18 acetylase RimI-like enzyme
MRNIQTQKISSEQTLSLRQKVLRPYKLAQDCIFAEDSRTETFHIGAFKNKKIIGIATFTEEANSQLPSKRSFRLRGMASDPDCRNQGIGRMVLDAGINELKIKGATLLWCNTREKAFLFYEKLGFSYLGPFFDLPGIGPHKVMYKYL